MFPRLFTIPAFELAGRTLGPFTLHSYGVLLAIAFVAGLWIASRQARREGLDGNKVADLAIYVLLSGLLGAKLMLLVVEWRSFSFSMAELLTLLQSGGVFYGGLLLALPVAFWYSRSNGLDAWKTADALAPGVILGQAIGRLGCLCAGCCHGAPTSLPWGITYTDEYASRTVGVPLGQAMHPVQLYESILAFGILWWLLRTAARKRFDGQVVLSYLGLYAVARFALETVRGDVARGLWLGGLVSTSQLVAIGLLALAAFLWPRLSRTRALATAPAAEA